MNTIPFPQREVCRLPMETETECPYMGNGEAGPVASLFVTLAAMRVKC